MRFVSGVVISLMYICLAIITVPVSASSTAEKVYENAKGSIFTIFSVDEENKEKTAFGIVEWL